METLKEIYDRHSSDKRGNSTYLSVYEEFFSPIRDHKLSLLELGIFRGESLLAWEEYFPNAQIVGLDVNSVSVKSSHGRIATVQGSQADTATLTALSKTHAQNGFDIVIDDASHLGFYTKISFWHLFDYHLKPGGLFFIEDWGTGYWDDWPDGSHYQEFRETVFQNTLPKRLSSHDFGMVGFIKQLVDECHYDAIRRTHDMPPTRQSKFSFLTIYDGLAVVKKKP